MEGVKSECGECFLPSKAMCPSRRKQNWNLDTVAAKIRVSTVSLKNSVLALFCMR